MLEEFLTEIRVSGMPNGVSLMQSVRQSDTLGSKNSLIFVYGMVMPDDIEKKYGKLLRNFLALQFIFEIKSESMLNVIATGTRPQSTGGNQVVNPAIALMNMLGGVSNQQSTMADVIGGIHQQQSLDSSKYEYQQKINEFLDFAKNQIQHDPRYVELNPIISDVTVENLITVPLIIGTKVYKIKSHIMMLIILVSVTNNIPLTTEANLDKILGIIRNLKQNDYGAVLMNSIGVVAGGSVASFTPSNGSPVGINDFVSRIEDQFYISVKRFKKVTSLGDMERDINITMTSDKTVFNSVQSRNIVLGNDLNDRAFSLFTSFVSTEMVGVIQSFAHAIVSADDVNIPEKIMSLQSKLLSGVYNVYNLLTSSISAAHDDAGNIEELMSRTENFCKSNAESNISGLFGSLRGVRYSINDNTRDKLILAVENVNSVAISLMPLIDRLINNLVILGSNNNRLEMDLKSLRVEFTDAIETFFRDEISKAHVPGNQQSSSRLANILNIGGVVNAAIDLIGREKNMIANLSTSIGNILYFLFLYSYFSFMCEYIYKLDVDMKIAKRDAMTFPNYCLVLPMTVIEGIYYSIVSKQVANQIRDGNVGSGFSAHNINPMKMISKIGDVTKSPNLIVVDEKKGDVYYKLMFMKGISKINLASIESYVKHQSNFIRKVSP